MIQGIVAGSVIAGALFFLLRHYYRVFTGKKSACSCGTKNIRIKNGKATEGSCCSCGNGHACCCQNKKTPQP